MIFASKSTLSLKDQGGDDDEGENGVVIMSKNRVQKSVWITSYSE